jgi:hypothetical protein
MIVRKAEKEEEKECATDGCGEPARCKGFCNACYSGWRYLRDLELEEISAYLWRRRRLVQRGEDAQRAARRDARKHLKRVS